MSITRAMVNLGAAALAVALLGCDAYGTEPGPDTIETADFLQVAHHDDVLFLSRTTSANDVMDALFMGHVSVDDAGCIRLETESDYGVTAVWPFGYTLDHDGDSVRVLDESGEAVATLGGELELGGGEVPELHDGIGFTDADQQLAHDRCPGYFWIVAEVVSP